MSLNLAPNQPFSGIGTTQGSAGARNADALPTASVVHNGVIDSSLPVTVTNIGTGLYTLTGTIPLSYSPGDTVFILMNATVQGFVLTPQQVLEIIVVPAGSGAGQPFEGQGGGVGPFVRAGANQIIYMVQGASAPIVETPIWDQNYNTIDSTLLYPATCVFQLAMSPMNNVVNLLGIAQVEQALDGVICCRYYWNAEDTANWGNYLGQFLLTLNNGSQIVLPELAPIEIVINESLAL